MHYYKFNLKEAIQDANRFSKSTRDVDLPIISWFMSVLFYPAFFLIHLFDSDYWEKVETNKRYFVIVYYIGKGEHKGRVTLESSSGIKTMSEYEELEDHVEESILKKTGDEIIITGFKVLKNK